jgi:ADP-ribosylglycohydrolase
MDDQAHPSVSTEEMLRRLERQRRTAASGGGYTDDSEFFARRGASGADVPLWDHRQGTAGRMWWQDGIDYRDRYRGCLLGVAIGDALGRPAEGMRAEAVAERFGRLRDFRPWRGWTSGPVGTVTDDTQLTKLVAESLVDRLRVDPEDLARRLVAWLPQGRGMGVATRRAVEQLAAGVSWAVSGEDSDGNGAAMRVAPVGLAYSTDLDLLRRSAVLSSLPTHTGRTGLVGTVAQAHAVARLVHQRTGRLDPEEFLDGAVRVVSDLHDPGVVERAPLGRRVTISGLFDRLAGLRGCEPAEAFADLYNGALITESLPAAWWCFLASPEEPERVIETAVAGGRDADTVAALAGALVGAYNGESALPSRWLDDLEYAEELRALADRLLEFSQPPASGWEGASPGPD